MTKWGNYYTADGKTSLRWVTPRTGWIQSEKFYDKDDNCNQEGKKKNLRQQSHLQETSEITQNTRQTALIVKFILELIDFLI